MYFLPYFQIAESRLVNNRK